MIMMKRFYIVAILCTFIFSMCGCAQGADIFNNISVTESAETESISDVQRADVETQKSQNESGVALPDISIDDGAADKESYNAQAELVYNEDAVSTEGNSFSENDTQAKNDDLQESDSSEEGSLQENSSSELQDGENAESELELPMDVW